MGKGKKRRLANWLQVYKCKSVEEQGSENVREQRTIVTLPLQFVPLNNLKQSSGSVVFVWFLCFWPGSATSLKGLTELELCCRVEGGGEGEVGGSRHRRRQLSWKKSEKLLSVLFTVRGGDTCIC